MNNKMENLKAVRSDLIRDKQKLERKIQEVEDDIKAVDRMIARYGDQPALELDSPKGHANNGREPKSFSGAVMAVLNDAHPASLTAAQIRNEVIHRGFKPTAKSFKGATYAMLSNLNKAGLIEKPEEGQYRAKKKEESEE